MAHTCPTCGCLCHCGGDIDDICFGEADEFCGCCEDPENDEEGMDNETEYDDYPLNPPIS